MQGDDAAQQAEQWKQKYYAGLEQLERQERAWAQTEALLRLGLSRLTLLAEPGQAELERPLEQLRRAVRQGTPSIELGGLLDTIAAVIAALDQRRSGVRQPRRAPEEEARDALLQLLDSLELPRGMAHKARALHKRIAAGTADPLAAVRQIAEFLHETFQFVAPASTDPGAMPAADRKSVV